MSRCKRVYVLVAGLLVAGAAVGRERAPANSIARPVTVSPGRADGFGASAHSCPTFSWGGVERAASYELVVVRAESSSGEALGDTALRVTLPGSAHSYTPDLGSCLEGGRRYSWLTRAKVSRSGDDAEGNAWSAWSEPSFFEVVATPSAIEVEAALEVLRRHLEGGDAVLSAEAPKRRDLRDGRAQRVGREEPETASTDPSGTARVAAAATAPALGSPSLRVSANIALGAASNLFKAGVPFLWDDAAGNTALGRDALASGGGTDGRNTALGRGALETAAAGTAAAHGSNNTALGYHALRGNLHGFANTAVGAYALAENEQGAGNTAFGVDALRANSTGGYNVAIGPSALRYNFTGQDNIAIGFRALHLNTSGNGNIAIGNFAYGQFGPAHDNILIGAPAIGTESGSIRLGSSFSQQRTFLAGDVAILGQSAAPAPTNRLHVEESINGTATPANHVALIKNTDPGNSADVLALQIAGTSSPLISNNFVTFFLGDGDSVGAIEGNGTNSVVLAAGGADYAEWLPLLDPAEAAGLVPGDVVGLHGDAVSRRTAGASHLFVVSTSPIVAGNDPGQDLRHLYARVAFVGQAPVKVAGRVRAGDLLVASGRDDGMAVALAPEKAARAGDPARLVVGRALESFEGEGDGEGNGTSSVRALVGLPGPEPWASLLREQSRRVVELEERLQAVERALRLRGSPHATSVSLSLASQFCEGL